MSLSLSAWLLDAFAVVVAAASGVLAGRGRGVDLFGACFLGLVTAFGGGTIRDLVLDVPVAWARDTNLLGVGALSCAVCFFIVRRREDAPWASGRAFILADALSLSLFTVAGVAKAQAAQAPWPVALILGVLTGVAGGIARDALLGTVPLVFRPDTHFYATAATLGALVQVAWFAWRPGDSLGLALAAAAIFALRLGSMRLGVRLPALSLLEEEVAPASSTSDQPPRTKARSDSGS